MLLEPFKKQFIFSFHLFTTVSIIIPWSNLPNGQQLVNHFIARLRASASWSNCFDGLRVILDDQEWSICELIVTKLSTRDYVCIFNLWTHFGSNQVHVFLEAFKKTIHFSFYLLCVLYISYADACCLKQQDFAQCGVFRVCKKWINNSRGLY